MPVEAGFGHFWLDLRFEDLRQVIVIAENLLVHQQQVLHERVQEALPGLSLDELDQFGEDAWLENWWLEEQLPQVLRRSLFIVCYARIESLLNNLCRAAKAKEDLPLTLGDLEGMGIHRAKRYLSKLANLKSPFWGLEWSRLTEYNRLRNNLVHGDGRPGDSQADSALIENIQNHPLLELDDHGYIIIGQGFCEEVVDTAHQFFQQFPRALIVEAWRYGVWR